MLKDFDAPVSRWDKALHAITDQLHGKSPAQNILLFLTRPGERRNSILRWISDEPYEKHHIQTKDGVLKGTGKWLLHDPTFMRWKNESASSILWLHGIPGSGKSKLTCVRSNMICAGLIIKSQVHRCGGCAGGIPAEPSPGSGLFLLFP
jgi:hypothetical protein